MMQRALPERAERRLPPASRPLRQSSTLPGLQSARTATTPLATSRLADALLRNWRHLRHRHSTSADRIAPNHGLQTQLRRYGRVLLQRTLLIFARKNFHGPARSHPTSIVHWSGSMACRRLDWGPIVDQQLQKLMKELGEAINESLSDSEQIAEVIAKIKAGGYDVFLVLEATIGFNKTRRAGVEDASQRW